MLKMLKHLLRLQKLQSRPLWIPIPVLLQSQMPLQKKPMLQSKLLTMQLRLLPAYIKWLHLATCMTLKMLEPLKTLLVLMYLALSSTAEPLLT